MHVITFQLHSQLQIRRRESHKAVFEIADTGSATDGFSHNVLLWSHCSEYSALANVVIAVSIMDLQPNFRLNVSGLNIPSNLT